MPPRSTQYCELGWGSLHYLWIWEGRKKEKRSSYTSLSTDTQCCFLQLRYFPAIIATLKMPSWDCKNFCSVEFLASKTLSSELGLIRTHKHFFWYSYLRISHRAEKILQREAQIISNYKIVRIWLYYLVYRLRPMKT